MYRSTITFLLLLLLLAFLGCAKRGAPPGGPPDRTPPKVVATVPSDGEVLIPPDSPITVDFNEPVKSDLTTVLLYPPVEGASVRFKKKAVQIVHRQPLKDNTTYSLILTPSFSDRHSNRIGKTFELAFSTGKVLDTLELSGYVLDGELLTGASGAVVAVYADSSMSQPPMRITYSSEDGHFHICHLPHRKVWLFAGTGIDIEMEWDKADKIAVPSKPTLLPNHRPLFLALAANDTLPPSLLAVGALDSRTVRLKFDEQVRLDTLNTSLHGSVLWLDPADSLSVMVRMKKSPPGLELSIRACDRFYNCADVSGIVPAEAPQDTIPPSLVKKKGYLKIARNEDLRIAASEPFSANISATVNDSAAGFDTIRTAPNVLELKLDDMPSSGANVWIVLDSLCDEAGNCAGAGDTIAFSDTLKFTVLRERLGEVIVSGIWQCENPVLFLRGKNGKIITLIRGGAKFGNYVPGGAYSLWRFCDNDRDGRWTPGRLTIFRLSEPMQVYSDTISVRPGWESKVNWQD